MEVTCINCKCFYFENAQPHYSQRTPGSDFEMGCIKNVWQFDPYDMSLEEYREKLLTAKKCEQFISVKTEVEKL